MNGIKIKLYIFRPKIKLTKRISPICIKDKAIFRPKDKVVYV